MAGRQAGEVAADGRRSTSNGYRRRSIAAVAVASATATLLAACGGTHGQVVAQVGDVTITKVELQHWLSVMAPREGAPEPPRFAKCIAHLRELAAESTQIECRREYDELKRSAFDYLLVSQWVLGEAAERGISVSERDVDRRLSEEYGSPEGKFEYKDLLAGSRTIHDVRFETRIELAETRLRQLLATYANEVSSSQIARYYKLNAHRFYLRERRYVDLIGNIANLTAAKARLRQVGRGAGFASSSFRLWLERPNYNSIPQTHRILEHAIFRARPNVIVGPMRIGGLYFMFKVADIRPAGVQSLAAVKDTIKRELGAKRRVRFVERWRGKWRARTTCTPAYVIQKCKQYHGEYAPEDPLEIN